MRRAAVAAGLLAAVAGMAETWYWKGGGEKNSFAYDWTEPGNWRNAQDEEGVPAEGDLTVFDQGYTSGHDLAYVSASSCQNGKTAPLDGMIAKSWNCVHQGNVLFKAGGTGVEIHQNSSWYGGLGVEGDGDVRIYVAPGKTFGLQKQVFSDSSGGAAGVVKTGAGIFNSYSQGRSAWYNIPNLKNYKLREGTWRFNTEAFASGANLVFDSDNPDARFMLGWGDWTENNVKTNALYSWHLPNGCIRESEAVANLEHGFESYSALTNQYLRFTGTPEINPVRFTGKFRTRAGLVWDPDPTGVGGAHYEFHFAKAAQPTEGGVIVSNGLVRLCEGATFNSLGLLRVCAGAVFEVDEGSGYAMSVKEIELETGAKLRLGAGVGVFAESLKVDGADPGGNFYTAENCGWIEGGGRVFAGSGAPEGSATEHVWVGGSAAGTLVTDAANWEDRNAPDRLAGTAMAKVPQGGTLTLPEGEDVVWRGIEAKAGTVFADAGGTFILGAGGIKIPEAESATEMAWGWPATIQEAQTWEIGANVKFEVAAGLSGVRGPLWIKGAGEKIFSARSRYSGEMNVTGGVTRVRGMDSLGAQGGTAKLGSDETVFGSSTNSCTVDTCLLHGDYRPVKFEAGARVRFGGKFCCTAQGKAITLKPDIGAKVEFAGGYETKGITSFERTGDGPKEIHVLNVPMLNGDRIYMRDPGLTVHFHEPGNKINGNVGDFERGRFAMHAPYALDAVAAGAAQRIHMRDEFVLDLNGYDQAMGLFHAKGGAVTSGTHAVLHVTQNHYPPNYDDIPWGASAANGVFGTTNLAVFAGGAGISLEGDRREHRLLAESTSTGVVQVAKGRLIIEGAGAWPNASEAVVKGGTLVLGNDVALGRRTVVRFEGEGGKIEIGEKTVQVGEDGCAQVPIQIMCEAIYVNGRRLPRGWHGSAQSGAQHKNDALFAGKGMLGAFSSTDGTVLIIR